MSIYRLLYQCGSTGKNQLAGLTGIEPTIICPEGIHTNYYNTKTDSFLGHKHSTCQYFDKYELA
jgi:hypothetical protein